MDCCGYGYRGPYGWEGYWPAGYCAPAHEPPPPPYARYYYPPHYPHHAEHAMSMEYGAYAVKESRARRVLSRRERAHLAAQHVPLPHTPPLECGMNSRGPPYCEPPMWPHFQQGMSGVGGWNGMGGAWGRSACREPMRYAPDCRLLKGNMHPQACAQDGAPHYNSYDLPYNGEAKVKCAPAEQARVPDPVRPAPDRESLYERPRPPTPEKRPPVVPLPAFQQAFGSTEIGKFAEAFSRADAAHDADDAETFAFDPFDDWDGAPEPQWLQPPPREIKCEDNF
ncbi:uncharacterized protein LOC121731313 [Aricia agestis]|uniref:uncharacterized protein LOC121731313 n=1 Tax=Aricia agestis TaxID=91739 RepID=UPI001C20B1AD|nr:uncharacterized protein LOC121731313 [Aricia agestis]